MLNISVKSLNLFPLIPIATTFLTNFQTKYYKLFLLLEIIFIK